ncbi:MAG: fasciclin domain-containing protein [Balneolaceae bacterium]|nr:MAG: fasciclin domain-containing protein [Balneolaceae bacterium]
MISLNLSRLLLLFIIPLFSLTMLNACSDDNDVAIVDPGTPDPEPEPEDEFNLVELAQSDDRFTVLVDLLVRAELVEALSGDTELTVFAPTNDAFEALGVDPADLDDGLLFNILMFHVTAGKILSGDLGPGTDFGPSGAVEMLNGEKALVQALEGVVLNGKANVVVPDLEATNGVIHAIDDVLLPAAAREELGLQNLVDIARADEELSTLVSIAEELGLEVNLKYLPNYTAFAPTNAAFEAISDVLAGIPESARAATLTGILVYHVLQLPDGPVPSTTVVAEAPFTAPTLALEEPIYLTVNDGNVFVNRTAQVIDADIEATNGIIHKIDGVLLPNLAGPVTGVVSKNFNLSTLLGFVAQRPDVLGLLASERGQNEEFTVFAPTNEAFKEALAAFPDLTDEQITEILTYHVVVGPRVLSTMLEDGAEVETFQGENITVSITDDGVFINESEVDLDNVDLEANNGVVHIINSVLVPPSFLE